MQSAFRALEIILYAVASFLPFVPPLLYSFRPFYRFKIRTARIIVAFFVVAYIALIFWSTTGVPSYFINICTTMLLILISMIVVKGHYGQLLTTVFIVQNTAILVRVLAKYSENFFAQEYAAQYYRWTNLICLIIWELAALSLYRYFTVNVYGPALSHRTNTNVWSYLWVIPATYYMIWNVYLFSFYHQMTTVSLMRRTATVVMMAIISIGAWITNFIICMFLNEEAQHERYERIQSELQDELNQDKLTKAASRTYGTELLQKCMLRHDSTYVLMADIDHFKTINDTYGHDFGDKALIEFTRALQKAVRSTDTVVRWGGDEFLCVFEGVTDDNVDLVGAKLKRAIHQVSIPNDREMIHLTSSMGFTKIRSTDLTTEAVVKRADEALYEAKQGGRDRFVIKM